MSILSSWVSNILISRLLDGNSLEKGGGGGGLVPGGGEDSHTNRGRDACRIF